MASDERAGGDEVLGRRHDIFASLFADNGRGMGGKITSIVFARDKEREVDPSNCTPFQEVAEEGAVDSGSRARRGPGGGSRVCWYASSLSPSRSGGGQKSDIDGSAGSARVRCFMGGGAR